MQSAWSGLLQQTQRDSVDGADNGNSTGKIAPFHARTTPLTLFYITCFSERQVG